MQVSWRKSDLTLWSMKRLSHWIEAARSDTPVLRANLISVNHALFHWMERLGLWQPMPEVNHYLCGYCDSGAHSVYRTVDGESVAYCPENGEIPVPETALSRVSFNEKRLLEVLAEAACVSPDIRYYGGGKVVQLGWTTGPKGARLICGYAQGLGDSQTSESMLQVLRTEFPTGPGLILTPSSVACSGILPHKHRLVQLHTVLSIEGDSLRFDVTTISRQFGSSRSSGRGPGRPSSQETSFEIWDRERHSQSWPQHQLDQAHHILALWPANGGVPPAPGTLKNQIRDFEDGRRPVRPCTKL